MTDNGANGRQREILIFEANGRQRDILIFYLDDKPRGASPRRDEDGTILACSTYSTYTVRIGIKKGGERSAGYG